MGGSIQVTSELGHGSTFRCVLPLVEVEPDDGLPPPGKLPLENRSDVSVQIVHPIQRRAIIDLLLNHGYTIADDCETKIIDVNAIHSPGSSGESEPTIMAANSSVRVIWMARVDDPTPSQQRPDQPILLKPILPDDLLRLLRAEKVEPQTQSTRSQIRTFATAPQSTTASMPGAPCLLLVDDSPVNQAVIRDFLTGAGYHVDLASSGQEAINAAESRRYCCVLMDLQMPGMDGIEAMIQMIQQDERRNQKPPPFVALTAHATDDHRQRCLNHGMKAFLVKPIDRQALIATVDSLITDAFAGTNNFEPSTPVVFTTESYSPQAANSEHSVAADEGVTIDNEVWQARLLKAAGNDPETAQSLSQAFLEEVPQLCKKFAEALNRQDPRAVRLATHTLKSCLKYVAEPSDWQFVERCELLAMAGNLKEIEPLASQVQSIAMRWVDLLTQSTQSDNSNIQ